MPRGDGTGPAGLGPRTGRGLGPCAGQPAPGWLNAARTGWDALRTVVGAGSRLGRGMGLGRGVGKGRNRWF